MWGWRLIRILKPCRKKDFVLLFVFFLPFLVNKTWPKSRFGLRKTLNPDSDPKNSDHKKITFIHTKLLRKFVYFYSICSVVVPKGEIWVETRTRGSIITVFYFLHSSVNLLKSKACSFCHIPVISHRFWQKQNLRKWSQKIPFPARWVLWKNRG